MDYEDFKLAEIEFWQTHLLNSAFKAMQDSTQYFFTEANRRRVCKLRCYQVLIGEIANFTNLFSSVNEIKEDFNEVICLLLSGHYKGCLLLLRTHFELANHIKRAVKSNQPIRKFHKERLTKGSRKFKTKTLQIPDKWDNEIECLYSQLSGFAHASGEEFSHSNLNTLPRPDFKQESFDFCIDLINQVVDHNAGLLKFCFKPKYWKTGYEDLYRDKAIEFLYKNLDSKLVKDYLSEL